MIPINEQIAIDEGEIEGHRIAVLERGRALVQVVAVPPHGAEPGIRESSRDAGLASAALPGLEFRYVGPTVFHSPDGL